MDFTYEFRQYTKLPLRFEVQQEKSMCRAIAEILADALKDNDAYLSANQIVEEIRISWHGVQEPYLRFCETAKKGEKGWAQARRDARKPLADFINQLNYLWELCEEHIPLESRHGIAIRDGISLWIEDANKFQEALLKEPSKRFQGHRS